MRVNYLTLVKDCEIFPDAVFDEEREDDIIDAGMCYSVELKADEYLARCEQNRSNLSKKLLAKNYEKKYIERALDYLESVNFLSDYRFAVAWLNSRKINHFEGRNRLLMELMNRGLEKEVCQNALDEFFEENSEEELCRSCLKKLSEKKIHFDEKNDLKKQEEKIIRSMMQKGFSYSLIKRIISEESDL